MSAPAADDRDRQGMIAVRNAIFTAGDGRSLDVVLQGSLMAMSRLAVETADSEAQAAKILAHYFDIALTAIPYYWASDRSPAAKSRRLT